MTNMINIKLNILVMRFHYIFILYSVSYVTKNTFENLKQILFIMNDGITVLKKFNILPITFCRLINGKKNSIMIAFDPRVILTKINIYWNIYLDFHHLILIKVIHFCINNKCYHYYNTNNLSIIQLHFFLIW